MPSELALAGIVLALILLDIWMVRKISRIESQNVFDLARMENDIRSFGLLLRSLQQHPTELDARMSRLETEMLEHLMARHERSPEPADPRG